MKPIEEENSHLKKEVAALKATVSRMQDELTRLDRLEKSLGYHELVLAKKVRDMNELEKAMENTLNQEHLDQIKKGLRKVERHEEMLFESARYIKETIRELEKVRQSHILHKEEQEGTIDRHKKDTDERLDKLKADFEHLETLRKGRRKEILDRVDHVEQDILDKMKQIEYQNKLIMQYLKRIDESIFHKQG